MKNFLWAIIAAVFLCGCGPSGAGSRKLDASTVPQEFRHLLPLAQKWGIGDDVARGDLIDGSSEADRKALLDAVGAHRKGINVWLDSFGEKEMSEEAGAFMYMLLGMEEMGI